MTSIEVMPQDPVMPENPELWGHPLDVGCVYAQPYGDQDLLQQADLVEGIISTPGGATAYVTQEGRCGRGVESLGRTTEHWLLPASSLFPAGEQGDITYCACFQGMEAGSGHWDALVNFGAIGDDLGIYAFSSVDLKVWAAGGGRYNVDTVFSAVKPNYFVLRWDSVTQKFDAWANGLYLGLSAAVGAAVDLTATDRWLWGDNATAEGFIGKIWDCRFWSYKVDDQMCQELSEESSYWDQYNPPYPIQPNPYVPPIAPPLAATLEVDTSSSSIFADKIQRKRRTFNRNVSAFRRDTPEDTVEELMRAVQDLQKVADEVQTRPMAAASVSPDGLPEHGQVCPALDGQYLRVGGPVSLTENTNQRRIFKALIASITKTTVHATTKEVVPTTIELVKDHDIALGSYALCKIERSATFEPLGGWHLATITGARVFTIAQETDQTLVPAQFGLAEMITGGIVAVQHGLDRIPQGMFVVSNHGWMPRIFIQGEGDIPAATADVVYFQTFSSEPAVLVIF